MHILCTLCLIHRIGRRLASSYFAGHAHPWEMVAQGVALIVPWAKVGWLDAPFPPQAGEYPQWVVPAGRNILHITSISNGHVVQDDIAAPVDFQPHFECKPRGCIHPPAGCRCHGDSCSQCLSLHWLGEVRHPGTSPALLPCKSALHWNLPVRVELRSYKGCGVGVAGVIGSRRQWHQTKQGHQEPAIGKSWWR
jgi:hypothetical protein